MDALEKTAPASAPDSLENYRRLVELQSQIVELARRNREAEQSYRLLRDHLKRKGWSSRPKRERIQNRPFRWLSNWLDRLRRRPHSASPRRAESTRPFTTLFSN